MTATFRFFTPLLIALLFALFGCNDAPNSNEKNVASAKKTEETPFDRLLNTEWADLGRDKAFIEQWERDGDGLRGTGVVMSEGDTVFIEHLQMVQRDSVWYYTVRIDGQNNGEPVFFECTMIDQELGLYVFENPEHDYPQNITYQFRNNGELYIQTRGFDGEEVRTDRFHMWPMEE